MKLILLKVQNGFLAGIGLRWDIEQNIGFLKQPSPLTVGAVPSINPNTFYARGNPSRPPFHLSTGQINIQF